MSEQEKKQNTVAEVLVKCLENEGVKYVFGIPGEENLDMMNALEKSDIRVIVVRHEQGAACSRAVPRSADLTSRTTTSRVPWT